MAAARPDGTGRAFSAVLRDLEGRSAWLTFLFSVPGKKGARWKFFSHVKRQTDVAMLLSHEDSVLVLRFLVVRDVPKIYPLVY